MINYSRPTITKKDIISVLNCLLEEDLGKDDLITQFEKSLAQFLSIKNCLLVNHLTSAFFLLFKSLQLKENDEVILFSFCHQSVLFAVESLGIKAVVLDVEKEKLFPKEETIANAINKNTKAVIVSHPMGYPTQMDKVEIIENLSKEIKEQITWIEECSTAFGSKLDDIFLGTNYDYGVFSFDAENIITTIKGAAIVSHDKSELKKVREINYKSDSISKGQLDFSITSIQAALGISELSFVEKFLKRREEISNFYKGNLQKGENKFLAIPSNSRLNNYALPIFFNNISLAKELFKKYKVEICSPLRQTVFHLLEKRKETLENKNYGDFPNSKNLFFKLLSVPLYPSLKKKELELIGNLLKNVR